MNDSSLPPRLRYASFQRYESAIASMVRNHPHDVPLIPPKGLSVITFAARLRDAILSYSRYDWKTDRIDREKFHAVCDDLGVFHNADSSVFGGSRKTHRAKGELLPAIVAATLVPIIDLLNYDQMSFFCRLVSLGLVQIPITVRGISPAEALKLEDSHDVLLKPQPDGTMVIT